jgi:hypothetical protein
MERGDGGSEADADVAVGGGSGVEGTGDGG